MESSTVIFVILTLIYIMSLFIFYNYIRTAIKKPSFEPMIVILVYGILLAISIAIYIGSIQLMF